MIGFLASFVGEICTMGSLNVVLPTIDVYTDASLVFDWFIRGHPVYAGMMTFPLALNYIFTTYKWWSMEKKKKSDSRKWSWVLVLLQVWQQWNSIKIIYRILNRDKCAEVKKKTILRELSSIEPFFEAVPSILIMTCIWLHTQCTGPIGTVQEQYSLYVDGSLLVKFLNMGYLNCSNTKSIQTYNAGNFCAVFDGFGGPVWFFITYGVSIIAGSYGICKFLQNGPAAILPESMLRWRFVKAFFVVMFSLVSKVWFAGNLTYLAGGRDWNGFPFWYGKTSNIWLFPLIFIFINILPNLILAIIAMASHTGLSKNLIKTLLDYPAFLLLPAFTNFIVGPQHSTSLGLIETSNQNLTVSTRLTAVNTGITVLCYGITIAVVLQLLGSNFDNYHFLVYFGFIFLAILCCSLLSTMVFYSFEIFDKINNCSPFRSKYCCFVLCAICVVIVVYVVTFILILQLEIVVKLKFK